MQQLQNNILSSTNNSCLLVRKFHYVVGLWHKNRTFIITSSSELSYSQSHNHSNFNILSYTNWKCDHMLDIKYADKCILSYDLVHSTKSWLLILHTGAHSGGLFGCNDTPLCTAGRLLSIKADNKISNAVTSGL